MTFKELMFNQTGYECFTTFFEDFTIAEKFGVDAVKDTYNRAFKEWKNNYKYLTELVMILNWKIWQHYEKNDGLATLYNTLWEKEDSAFNAAMLHGELSDENKQTIAALKEQRENIAENYIQAKKELDSAKEKYDLVEDKTELQSMLDKAPRNKNKDLK